MKESAVLRMYRVGHWLQTKKVPILPAIIQRTIRVLFACELPMSAKIGKGTQFYHNGLGVVIHEKAELGSNTRIYQNVTIGGRGGRGVPKIGHNVFIGCGACILGGVVIGDNAVIGANTCVIEDVSPNSVVVGPKAKVVK
ncbi:serine O-acetyltransferase [Cytobacillus oceanisediminis]|uniref:Serine acetyltransferase n=1 Tax=Cytobacillus oceanisediminis TaxID=665099 RepID=A0A2V3A4U7_9BACI|nr:serine acetyltransferase [Cytobacillus oceanisediminis]PWW31277.1 serine O-acetyltransferase [Cytobacillus oceanisediminis]